ncbi:hypothetical protein TEA_008159 [Camellia sinensis var. sinensis]|uniref:Major facilitator superfamily (MFS) profile domain-containing protein n=1 Tax=Camellia sinensis var. sinensis TaxID=542762 RepID=A0A4V3WLP2_CAMSN|nr:hypothetical protein TEA_008159 [Camellia sinensis var. sinensis]
MKEDTKVSNYCKFNSELLTLFTSSLYVDSLIASLFASLVTKTFGHRPSILVGGAAYLAGACFAGAASNVVMLILGRVMLGVGVGFSTQTKGGWKPEVRREDGNQSFIGGHGRMWKLKEF